MYKFKNTKRRSQLTSVEVYEGETIEQKISRITSNKEPITDGAPEIFTERKDGVIAAYNIRTDRWEIAAEAMDNVSAAIAAKRDGLPKLGGDDKIDKEVAGKAKEVNGVESIQGEKGAN